MQQQHQQQNEFEKDMRAVTNFVSILFNGHAITLTPFFRTNFGKEAIGLRGLVGFALIFLYGGFAGCPAMIGFFWVWLGAVIIQRFKQLRNWRNGIPIHSFYNGYPWLAYRLFPWIKDEHNAKAAEGFLCAVIGAGIMPFDFLLGIYVMLGAISIIGSQSMIVGAYQKRIQAMADAEIENRYVAEEYRRFKRERMGKG